MKKIFFIIVTSFFIADTTASAASHFSHIFAPAWNSIKHIFISKPTENQDDYYKLHVGYMSIRNPIDAYEEYTTQLMALSQNERISYIVIDINSPGGSGQTAEILSDLIKKISTKKPVLAFITGMGVSASYFIASAAPYIVAPHLAAIGSIGIRSMYEYEKDITFITSGKYKVPRYTPSGALEADYACAEQESINKLAELFFLKISAARGISVEILRSLEAKTFSGPEALELGLIDEIGTFDAVIEKIARDMKEKTGRNYSTIIFVASNGEGVATFYRDLGQ